MARKLMGKRGILSSFLLVALMLLLILMYMSVCPAPAHAAGEGLSAQATITANATAGESYMAGNFSDKLTVASPATYTVSYDANGGTDAPSDQVKDHDTALKLSGVKPAKAYTIKYNAAGGKVTPASKSVSCTFKDWNTMRDGSGASYAPGASYTANASVTLYAQWENPKAGLLTVPTRSGYEFEGWYTAASGGEKVSLSTTVTGSMTIYAHWSDPYNLKDETYSFKNYSDSDSRGGHCFGMSMTSAGYHIGKLDIGEIGGNESTPLYSFEKTQTVTGPICYYQGAQNKAREIATVAGGTHYKDPEHVKTDIASDWSEVVNYVKDHSYDGKGLLQIGFRKNDVGGHAVNFLRYEKVGGQDRIYAYDNNYPDLETYFYCNASGQVRQAPVQTILGPIDCIALRDVRIYFENIGNFDATHVVYMAKDSASVKGCDYSYMEGMPLGADYVMYTIPAGKDAVTIVPKEDNADFVYMGKRYSFGKVTGKTRGELRLASLKKGAVSGTTFTIFEKGSAIPTVTLSKGWFKYDGKVHKPKVTVKVGGKVLEESRDYTVKCPSGMKRVGDYVIKVTMKGEYSGSVAKTFTIEKAANPMVAKGKTVRVMAETLKEGSKVFAAKKAFFVKGAKGEVSYKKVSGNKKVAVASNGKVTVKKGLKKGTYKVKVKVTAKGNASWKSKTKKVTLKVKVI